MDLQGETGPRMSAHADQADEPSAAALAHTTRWWDEFAAGVEQVVAAWNSREAVSASVTFTRQSGHEISIAHRWASTELRLEGTRIRVTNRRAEPVRHNMGAATLVDFREGADGLVALAGGEPVSLDRLVERVVEPILRRVTTGQTNRSPA